MVIPPFSHSRIARVIRIIVVRPVLHIARVQRLHTQGSPQDLIGQLQCAHSVFGNEQLWSDSHGDREVGSELVVGPFATGTSPESVFVDSATVYEGGVESIL